METKQILEDTIDISKNIRGYSISQKEFWQQIPSLALEADGRTGHSDNYGRAFRTKYWALNSSIENGNYQVYVDLRTGDLVDAFHASDFSIMDYTIETEKKSVPAEDEQIIKLAFHLCELDASRILKELKKESKQPHGSYYNTKEKEAWRKEMREKYELENLLA